MSMTLTLSPGSPSQGGTGMGSLDYPSKELSQSTNQGEFDSTSKKGYDIQDFGVLRARINVG